MSSNGQTAYQPILFCFAGPSGSGKSTICVELTKDNLLQLSVSTTTRGPRSNEIEGTHYFFVDQAEFKKRVDQSLFLEHATYSGNSYGTERRNIDNARIRGADLVLDIDVQGVEQIKKCLPHQTVTVAVLPPSVAELRQRLESRAENSKADIEKRLDVAKREIEVLSTPGFSDYIIVNEVKDHSISRARAVIDAERVRASRISAAAFRPFKD